MNKGILVTLFFYENEAMIGRLGEYGEGAFADRAYAKK